MAAVVRQAFVLPGTVQHLQEAAGVYRVVLVAHLAIGIQPQAIALRGQQQAPAALGGARGGGFHQQREARRVMLLQGQQIDRVRQRVDQRCMGHGSQFGSSDARKPPCGGSVERGVEHGPTLQLGQTRLKISVPLVPPKPKPFDITTSTLAWRASLGT